MDALTRYGGAIVAGAVPTALGSGISLYLHNVAQGNMSYLNQAANTMGDAAAIGGLVVGIVVGIVYAMRSSQNQQNPGQQQGGNQQNQNGNQNPRNPPQNPQGSTNINIYNIHQ